MIAGGRITRWVCRRRGHRWGEWQTGEYSPAVEVRYCGRRRCYAQELRAGPAVRSSLERIGAALRAVQEQQVAFGRSLAAGFKAPRVQVPPITAPAVSLGARAAREAADFERTMDATAKAIRDSGGERATFPLRGASS